MNQERKWGAYHIQKRGKAKWTTLRGGFYYGEGYTDTKEQAASRAKLRLELLRAANPEHEYRTDPELPGDTK